MPREEIIVPSRSISYEGIFSVAEVLDIIKRFLDDTGYTRVERVHEHKVFADGASIEIKGYHERRLNDQDLFEFDTFLFFSQIKDVEVAVNGEKKKLNTGKASINFKGILFTDQDSAWWKNSKKEITRYNAVIQWLADRFIFREHVQGLRAAGKRDVDELYALLLDYFQAQRYHRHS